MQMHHHACRVCPCSTQQVGLAPGNSGFLDRNIRGQWHSTDDTVIVGALLDETELAIQRLFLQRPYDGLVFWAWHIPFLISCATIRWNLTKSGDQRSTHAGDLIVSLERRGFLRGT